TYPSYALNLAQLGALCISNLCATKPAKYITLAETWLIFNNQDNKGKGYAINGRAITRSI
ncbi:hypothetical protein K5F44_14150, partial [Acinetobacter baumannii]